MVMLMIGWRRYDPFEDIMREIESVIREAFPYSSALIGKGTFYDVLIEDDKVKVIIELPGVRKEDIRVRFINEETLTVSVERSEEKLLEGQSISRFYNGFKMTIKLPAKVVVTKARATYRNGILTIEAPLMNPEKVKGFEVKIE